MNEKKISTSIKLAKYFQTRLHEEVGHLITGLWGCIRRDSNNEFIIQEPQIVSATPPNSFGEKKDNYDISKLESGYRIVKLIFGFPKLDFDCDKKEKTWQIISSEKAWQDISDPNMFNQNPKLYAMM